MRKMVITGFAGIGKTTLSKKYKSKVSLNFIARGTDFGEVVETYQNRISEYEEKLTHHHK